MSTSKSWRKSRTLWFNALIAALAALEASANLVQAYVPGNIYGWCLMLLVVGNAGLRIVTTQGLTK